MSLGKSSCYLLLEAKLIHKSSQIMLAGELFVSRQKPAAKTNYILKKFANNF